MKRKLVNRVSGVILGLSLIVACGTGVQAKMGDNPTFGQVMDTFKYSKYGTYARYDCSPGKTQVTCSEAGYYGSYKMAKYHVSREVDGKFEKIDCKKKETTSQPCYTTFLSVSSEVVRRYHSGVIKTGSNKQSSTAEKYSKTVYKKNYR